MTPALIETSPGSDWLTYKEAYAATRHSSLTQITPANAKPLVASPIVYDGLRYVSNTKGMYAPDARSGRGNRGTEISGDRVNFVTAGCHLIALKRLTGNLAFDME